MSDINGNANSDDLVSFDDNDKVESGNEKSTASSLKGDLEGSEIERVIEGNNDENVESAVQDIVETVIDESEDSVEETEVDKNGKMHADQGENQDGFDFGSDDQKDDKSENQEDIGFNFGSASFLETLSGPGLNIPFPSGEKEPEDNFLKQVQRELYNELDEENEKKKKFRPPPLKKPSHLDDSPIHDDNNPFFPKNHTDNGGQPPFPIQQPNSSSLIPNQQPNSSSVIQQPNSSSLIPNQQQFSEPFSTYNNQPIEVNNQPPPTSANLFQDTQSEFLQSISGSETQSQMSLPPEDHTSFVPPHPTDLLREDVSVSSQEMPLDSISNQTIQRSPTSLNMNSQGSFPQNSFNSHGSPVTLFSPVEQASVVHTPSSHLPPSIQTHQHPPHQHVRNQSFQTPPIYDAKEHEMYQQSMHNRYNSFSDFSQLPSQGNHRVQNSNIHRDPQTVPQQPPSTEMYQSFPSNAYHAQNGGYSNRNDGYMNKPSYDSFHQSSHPPHNPMMPRSQSESALSQSNIQSNAIEERLHGSRGLSAFPIVSFAFGGHMSVLNPEQAEDGVYKKGNISIHKLSDVLSATTFGQAMLNYPGILPETKADEIVSFINGVVLNFEHGYPVHVNGQAEKQLWELLRLFVHIDVFTEQTVDETILNIQKILMDQKSHLQSWATQKKEQDMPLSVVPPSVEAVEPGQILRMEKYLIEGRIEQACDTAVKSQLWGHALLLASMIDKPTYSKVVTEFTRRSFANNSPLKTLYMMFADRGDLLFTPSNDPISASPHARSSDGIPLSSNWEDNLSMIIGNRTANSSDIIEKLGDSLWRDYDLVHSSHFCYLVSEFCSYFQKTISKIQLVGGDHKRSNFFATPESIQRTEIYDYYRRKLAIKQTPQTQYVSPSHLAFKLVYAQWLVDMNRMDLASKYVSFMMNTVNQTKTFFSYTQTFLQQLHSLDKDIKQCEESWKNQSSLLSRLFKRSDTQRTVIASETKVEEQQETSLNQPKNEPPKEKKNSWFSWLSFKNNDKPDTQLNLGVSNKFKWSEKLQRYIPNDAKEEDYENDDEYDAPPTIPANQSEPEGPPTVPMTTFGNTGSFGSYAVVGFGNAPTQNDQSVPNLGFLAPPLPDQLPPSTQTQTFVPQPQPTSSTFSFNNDPSHSFQFRPQNQPNDPSTEQNPPSSS